MGAGHARRNWRYRDDLHVVAAAPRLSTPAATPCRRRGCRRLSRAAAAIAARIAEGDAQELPGGRIRLTKEALASVDKLFRRDSARLRNAVWPRL